MCSKGATRGPWGHNLKLTLDILELLIKIKNKVLVVFKGSCETYTRYSGVVDEDQKKVLGASNGSFLSNLVKGAIAFFNYFKEAIWKKSLGNPGLNW